MKKIFFSFSFIALFFFLSSCSLSEKSSVSESLNNNSNWDTTSVIEKNQDTSDSSIWTNEILNWSSEVLETEVNLEENLSLLFTEKEIIDLLKKEGNGNLLEELPRIETYWKEDSFYEYYMFLSVKENDVWKCNFLDLDKKNLCISLFNSKWDKSKFEKIYLDFWEDKDFIEDAYNTYESLSSWKQCKWMKSISSYLSCKKTLDLDFDVRKYFVKYSILERSTDASINPEYEKIVLDYYKIIKYWKLDSDFKYLFEE